MNERDEGLARVKEAKVIFSSIFTILSVTNIFSFNVQFQYYFNPLVERRENQ